MFGGIGGFDRASFLGKRDADHVALDSPFLPSPLLVLARSLSLISNGQVHYPQQYNEFQIALIIKMSITELEQGVQPDFSTHPDPEYQQHSKLLQYGSSGLNGEHVALPLSDLWGKGLNDNALGSEPVHNYTITSNANNQQQHTGDDALRQGQARQSGYQVLYNPVSLQSIFAYLKPPRHSDYLMTSAPPISHPRHRLVFDKKHSSSTTQDANDIRHIPPRAHFRSYPLSFTPPVSRSKSQTALTLIRHRTVTVLRGVSFRFPKDSFLALETSRSILQLVCSFEQVGGRLERMEFETDGFAEDKATRTVGNTVMCTLRSVYLLSTALPGLVYILMVADSKHRVHRKRTRYHMCGPHRRGWQARRARAGDTEGQPSRRFLQ